MTRAFAPATYPGLAGRAVLNTGGARGIGLAMAKALAGAGADVMLNGFGDADEIEATRKGLETDYGVTAHYSDLLENRYPLPRTVWMKPSNPCGASALRSRRIWTSTVRSST